MKAPRISADKLIKLIKKLGFRLARQSGSHMLFKNDAGKRITVPYHSKKTLHPKLVSQIMKDIDISTEKMKELL